MNYTNLVSSREDVFMAVEQTRVFKRPDSLRGDYSKRNQNKYCRYHKDVSHMTEECITLMDEIKKLIHHRYLQDYINNRRTRPQNDGPEVEPPRKIWTIFGRPHFAGETHGRKNVTSGKRRRGRSPMFTAWTSSLQSSSRGRTTTSFLGKVMHNSSTTLTATLWSSR